MPIRRGVPSARCRFSVLVCIAAALALFAPESSPVFSVLPRRQARRPPASVSAYAAALADVESATQRLRAVAVRSSSGVAPAFGREAGHVVRRGLALSGATSAADVRTLEKAFDAPLHALFLEQLAALRLRAVEEYEATVAERPNPLEAALSAERNFVSAAGALVRPGSGWSFEADRLELLELFEESHAQDAEIVGIEALQGRGAEVTAELARRWQRQAALAKRKAETNGAFPWDVKWQYMNEQSPVGLRGQYSQGRSVIECMLRQFANGKSKSRLLDLLGSLSVALSFDMLR